MPACFPRKRDASHLILYNVRHLAPQGSLVPFQKTIRDRIFWIELHSKVAQQNELHQQESFSSLAIQYTRSIFYCLFGLLLNAIHNFLARNSRYYQDDQGTVLEGTHPYQKENSRSFLTTYRRPEFLDLHTYHSKQLSDCSIGFSWLAYDISICMEKLPL
jgi:hypothetical protein